jgi:hypothetical protein
MDNGVTPLHAAVESDPAEGFNRVCMISARPINHPLVAGKLLPYFWSSRDVPTVNYQLRWRESCDH